MCGARHLCIQEWVAVGETALAGNFSAPVSFGLIIIIMYIYDALINALSADMIHINLF